MPDHSTDSAGEPASPRRESDVSGETKVLRAILEREAQSLPLNSMAVSAEDSALHYAAGKAFGSWAGALRAAGIEPARVRGSRRWSRQMIIEGILELAATGRPLNAAAVQHSESALAAAAFRQFRYWNDALRAAGIDPAGWCKRAPTWTKESIIRTIHCVHDAGDPLNHAAMCHNSVTQAAIRLFGSWDAALRAAGLMPEAIRLRRRPWQPDEIVQEIRRKAEAGEPLHACGVSPCTLYSKGVAFFGSWDAALSAAGLDPAKIRRRKLRERP